MSFFPVPFSFYVIIFFSGVFGRGTFPFVLINSDTLLQYSVRCAYYIYRGSSTHSHKSTLQEWRVDSGEDRVSW
jgi:hypothetical protein